MLILVLSVESRIHISAAAGALSLREIVPADMGPMSEPRDIVSLFGSPAFVYADLPRLAALWVRAFVRREDTFFYANKLRHVWSYLRTRWALHSARGTTHAVGEIGRQQPADRLPEIRRGPRPGQEQDPGHAASRARKSGSVRPWLRR